jgi:small subunit ribosomal protein S2
MSKEPLDKKETEKEEREAKTGRNSSNLVIDVDEMVKAGVYFGHKKSKRHPKMKLYISAVKNDVDIIDAQQTAEMLRDFLLFLQEVIEKGGKILFVGTKAQAKRIIKETAEETSMPYVNERWLGGFLTNFQTMLKRIEKFESLRKQKEAGELEKYTKKERIKIDKELKTFEEKFGGVKEARRVPELIFLLDPKENEIAAKEAKKSGIAVVGVCNTNVNPSLCDWVIPANNNSVSSIKYILEKIKETILGVTK